MRKIACAASAGMLVLAGCGSASEETITEEAGSDGGVITEEATPEPLVQSDPGITDRLYNRGELLRLDLQQQHPNGVVVRLTGIEAKSTETIVTAEFVNGGEREAYLANYDNTTYLQSMDGREFVLSTPPTNEDLSIAAGQRMQAELVFMGRIPADEPILVIFNRNDRGGRIDTSPGFRFELPVPDQTGTGSATETDSSRAAESE